MHGVLAALAAADEIDPATIRPSPLASVVFTFLLVSLILLLWSFVRHTRRAQANLGSARVPAPTGPTDTGTPGEVEGDAR
jgi:hypothetical protein